MNNNSQLHFQFQCDWLAPHKQAGDLSMSPRMAVVIATGSGATAVKIPMNPPFSLLWGDILLWLKEYWNLAHFEEFGVARRRPVRRLIDKYEPGEGKAAIVSAPKDLSHILFVASKGELGRRNVAIIWMLFGSGLRITEVGQLKVSDVYYPDGELKKSFVIPGPYTKTGKPRTAYIIVPQQRDAIDAWRQHRISEKAMLSEDSSFGGLSGGSPLFLSRKGAWRKFAFNAKRYKTNNGIKETLVCASLENSVREIIKSAGVQGGSSHSGRRSLATLMDHNGYELELIQKILGHEDEEMSLAYIDPNLARIDVAMKNLWRGVKMPKSSESCK